MAKAYNRICTSCFHPFPTLSWNTYIDAHIQSSSLLLQ